VENRRTLNQQVVPSVFENPCLAAALATLKVLDSASDWLALTSASSPVVVS
jgi:hypothetical protein